MAFSIRPGFRAPLMAIVVYALGPWPGAAQEKVDLPQSVTAPPADPRPGAEAAPAPPAETKAAPQELPATTPAPQQRPTEGKLTPPEAAAVPPVEPNKTDGPKPLQGPPLPASLVVAMPPEEVACRAELTKLGVSFEPREPESGENGCSMPYPLAVSSFGDKVVIEPPLVSNCAIARTAASFVQGPVQAAAQRHLGTDITGLSNGSGYVCRPRRGTQKISEHALGNAIDIMSFALPGERTVVVGQTKDPKEAAFVDDVRRQACGPFTTVLGPGSDADHADHLHFDLADRKEGVTFCQ